MSADELVAIVRRMVRRASGGATDDLDDAVQETLCRLLALDAHTFGTTRALRGMCGQRREAHDTQTKRRTLVRLLCRWLVAAVSAGTGPSRHLRR